MLGASDAQTIEMPVLQRGDMVAVQLECRTAVAEIIWQYGDNGLYYDVLYEDGSFGVKMTAAKNGLQWLSRARPRIEQQPKSTTTQSFETYSRQQGAAHAAAAWQQQMMPHLQPDINLLMAGCPNSFAVSGMSAVTQMQLGSMLPMFLGLGSGFNYGNLRAQMAAAMDAATVTVAARAAASTPAATSASMVATSAKQAVPTKAPSVSAAATAAAMAAISAKQAVPTKASSVPAPNGNGKARTEEKPPSAYVTAKVGCSRTKLCCVSGCPTKVDRNNLCFKHGSRGKCKTEECRASAIARGFCFKHGSRGICSESECVAASAISRGGLCLKHNRRVICITAGCKTVSQARGLCFKHGAKGVCSVEGCNTNAQARHLCGKHGGKGICKVETCTTNAYKAGFCFRHGGNGTCMLSGCTSNQQSKGRCRKHLKICRAPGCTVRAVALGMCEGHTIAEPSRVAPQEERPYCQESEVPVTGAAAAAAAPELAESAHGTATEPMNAVTASEANGSAAAAAAANTMRECDQIDVNKARTDSPLAAAALAAAAVFSSSNQKTRNTPEVRYM